MRSYDNNDDSIDKTAKAAETARLMKEFLDKGGKVEAIPYGVTSQPMGQANPYAFYIPPSTTSPLAYKRRINKEKRNKK
jgi:hypothetical protein